MLTLLLAANAVAQAPMFGGHDAAWWREKLAADPEPTIAQLAAGLADAKAEVADQAAQICEQVGASAAPLVPDLVRSLGTAGSWCTRVHCANALAAIGVATPPVLDALMAQIEPVTVPRLRSECARALARLDARAGHRLLAAADAGRLGDQEDAVEVFLWIGEPVVDSLLEAMARQTPAGDVARAALPRLGWRAATRLERAGHQDLAQLALRIGPQQHVAFVEEFVFADTAPQPPAERLPTITWESGFGHGDNLNLFRGSEDARGLRVDAICLGTSFPDGKAVASVTARTTTLPRPLALDATRQLAVIRGMTMQPKPGTEELIGMSSASFHARVHAEVDGKVLLDAAFGGYPAADNLPKRFRAEAAVQVLLEAMADAQWTDRQPTANDREIVRERCGQTQQDEWWVVERLHAMAKALQVK